MLLLINWFNFHAVAQENAYNSQTEQENTKFHNESIFQNLSV